MSVLALAKTEIKKHVGAVHTRGKLTLLQRKVANVLLLNAYNELETESRHHIRIRDLAAVAGFDSKDGVLLKDSILSLMTIVIQWNALDDEGDDWEASPFLAYARVRKGICTYGYSPELREKLYKPEIYARINLSVQREFRSGYSLALYENCVRFRKIGSTGWIELETWRDLLGVQKGTYSAFKEFRRRVLNPAIKEVNDHSDILVTLELPRREKRRIVALKFTIKNSAQLSLGLENQAGIARYEVVDERRGEETNPLTKRLSEFGLETQAEDLIGKYDEDRINANLDIIQAKIESGENIKSVAALARDAIEKDYRPMKTKVEVEIGEVQAEAKKRKSVANAAREAAEQKQKKEEIQKGKEENQRLDGIYAKLSAEDQQEVAQQAEQRFIARCSTGMIEKYNALRRQGTAIEAMPIGIKSMFLYQRREAVKLLAQEPQT